MLFFDAICAAKITIIDYFAKKIDKKSFSAHFWSIFGVKGLPLQASRPEVCIVRILLDTLMVEEGTVLELP